MGMADSLALPPRLLALLQDMPLEELAFVPVPVRARHDGWTKARQQGFILRLALGGCSRARPLMIPGKCRGSSASRARRSHSRQARLARGRRYRPLFTTSATSVPFRRGVTITT